MTEPQAQVKAPNTVPVRAPDGSLYEVPNGELSQLPEGATIASQEDVAQAKADAEYGGLKGQAIAAGLGTARGLTLGASDYAATKVGDLFGKRKEAAEALKGYEEANPYTSKGFEIAGAVAPALLSGGVGAEAEGASLLARGARAAGTIPKALYGAGRVAEDVAAGVVGTEAKSLLGRTAQKAIQHAAGAAVEGAGFGAGQELSDAAINNHELTAEKFWAGAGKGALLGGALGGGLGAAGELAGTAVKGLGSSLTSKMEGSSLSEWLEKKANESTWRALGGQKKLTRDAENWAEGGFAGVAARIRKEAPELVGEKISRSNAEEVASKWKERDNKGLEELFTKADEKGAELGVQPKAADVFAEAKAIASKLRSDVPTPGAKLVADKIDGFIDGYAEKYGFRGSVDDGLFNVKPGNFSAPEVPYGPAGSIAANDTSRATMSFRELQQMRIMSEREFKGMFQDPTLKGYAGSFRDLNRTLEKRLETSLDELSTQAGGKSIRDEYKKLKLGWQTADFLEKAAANLSAQSGGNLGVTLTQKLASAAGASVGALTSGPIGAAVGGAAGLVGGRLAREHGELVMADVLSRLGKLAAVENAAFKVDQRITEGVSGFLRGARAEASTARPHGNEAEAYIHQAQRISQIAGNPEAMQAHIERSIGDLGPQSPNITRALAAKAANDISFLASKAPKMNGNLSSLTPQFEKPRFSKTEAIVFGQTLKVVKDPLSVLDDMRHGTLNHAKVEALRATSPRIYEQIRNVAVEQSMGLKSKLPYAKKLQLGILFQAPTDETLTPEFIQAMQATTLTDTAPPATGPKPPQNQGGSRRPVKLDALATYGIGPTTKGE